MIKSYIQGKIITNTYTVVEKRDTETGKLTEKPRLEKKSSFEYSTLTKRDGTDFVVDGEIGFNDTFGIYWFTPTRKINLNEDEAVAVEEKIYRADMNAYMIHTDKVIEETDEGYLECKETLNNLLREYNKMKIEESEELAAYCKVHNLDPASTDYDELVKIVSPNTKAIKYISTLPWDSFAFKNILAE